MNLLYKLRLLYSKKMIGEILLIVQLVCVTTFAIYVVPPIVTYMKSLQAFNHLYAEVDLEHAYFCNPSGALMVSNDEKRLGRTEVSWGKVVNSIDHVEKVLKCGITNVFYVDEQGGFHAATLLIYPRETAEFFKLEMGESEEDVCTVKGNREALRGIGVGEIIEACYMEREGSLQIKVKDEISEEALPVMLSHGTMANISSYAWLHPDNIQNPIFVMVENEASEGETLWNPCYILITDGREDPEAFTNELENRLIDVGSVRTMKEEIKESQSQLFIENGVFITRFVIFFLLIFFGYGGYIYLQERRKMQTYALMEICGMSKRRLAVEIVGANMLLIAAGTWIGFLLHTKILYVFTGYDMTRMVGLETIGIVFVIYVIIYILWQGKGLLSMIRKPEIRGYKEERQD